MVCTHGMRCKQHASSWQQLACRCCLARQRIADDHGISGAVHPLVLKPQPVCRYSAASEAHVLWGLGIRHPSEVAKMEQRLSTAGFPTIDISGIEAAQVHSAVGQK